MVSSVRGKVVHDGKQKTGLAGCHGIELGVIKEGHGGDYTLLRALGKEQGQGPAGGLWGAWTHQVGVYLQVG